MVKLSIIRWYVFFYYTVAIQYLFLLSFDRPWFANKNKFYSAKKMFVYFYFRFIIYTAILYIYIYIYWSMSVYLKYYEIRCIGFISINPIFYIAVFWALRFSWFCQFLFDNLSFDTFRYFCKHESKLQCCWSRFTYFSGSFSRNNRLYFYTL